MQIDKLYLASVVKFEGRIPPTGLLKIHEQSYDMNRIAGIPLVNPGQSSQNTTEQ